MKRLLGSLRVRLAFAIFVASYAPVLILLTGVNYSTVEEQVVNTDIEETTVISSGALDWGPVILLTVALLPVVAAFSWWLSGRLMRPLEQALSIQETLIEETSHELRTPLAILTNNADVVLAHPSPTADVYRKALERSRAAAGRMTSTIDSLLVDARGRARTVTRQPADITHLAHNVVEALQPVASKAAVTLQLATGVPHHAAVDPVSVERAITNLVTNAIEAAPSGSVVAIEVGAADSTVSCSVTDQGVGLTSEQQDKVFDRYWQADDDTGVGIGLAIVRQIANAHGGDVRVESPVANGRGTRFTLTLSG